VTTRRAVTLVEVLVASAVFLVLAAAAYPFLTGAAGGTARAVEASDALRSTLIATELLRHDAARLFFQHRDDLVIMNDGRALSMLIPAPTADLWTLPVQPVTYTLAAVPAADRVYRLLRDDGAGPRPVAGCLLRDLLVRYVAPGEISAQRAYLEVTLIGLGSERPRTSYSASALLPLDRTRLPRAYPLPAVLP